MTMMTTGCYSSLGCSLDWFVVINFLEVSVSTPSRRREKLSERSVQRESEGKCTSSLEMHARERRRTGGEGSRT